MIDNDFFIESPAFAEGDEIPDQYTGFGSNMSPPLEWSKIPPHAKEFVIVCEDPDAPREQPFVHWVIYNIPADTFELREGLPTVETLSSGIAQGMNSAGHVPHSAADDGPSPLLLQNFRP
jgi:Raf kinase inhibitor-like YbhB/YbcL family protein